MQKQMLILAQFLVPGCVDQEDIDSVTCALCHSIVNNPCECENCQTIFCISHAKKWGKEKGICPLCRKKPWEIRNGCHKLYKRILDGLVFQCSCTEQVPYHKLESHRFWDHLETIKPKDTKQTTKKNPKSDKQAQGQKPQVQKPRAKDMVKHDSKPQPADTNQTKVQEKHQRQKPKTTPKFLFSYNQLGSAVWFVFDSRMNRTINENMLQKKFRVGGGANQKKFDLVGMKVADKYLTFDLKAQLAGDFIWRCSIQQQDAYVGYGSLSQRIEEQYQRYLKSAVPKCIKIRVSNTDYEINFEKMVQVNLKSNYERKITRNEY